MVTVPKKYQALFSECPDSLVQTILLDDELNHNAVDASLMEKALCIRAKLKKAMCTGVSKQEAFNLLEQSDEIDNEIHDAEKEYWFKLGIKMGYEVHEIINHTSHQ